MTFKELFSELHYRICHCLPDWYFNIKQGIPNLIKWLPIIWKDRDWDDDYLYVILEKKLKFMGDMQHKHGHAVNSEDIAKQLYYVSGLIHKYRHHDYSVDAEKETGYTERYGNKYPELTFNDNNSSASFKYLDGEQHKLWYRSYTLADELQEQDRQKVFDYIKQHSRDWWD